MKINIFQHKKELYHAFTEWFKSILSERESISIALSGGSTPKALFDYWATLPKHAIDWEKVRFFWGDERCVAPDDTESNYRMTKLHLFDKTAIPEGNIFRIRGENTPTEEAQQYGEVLMNELPVENGVPVFDIVMLGMGDDGHTASIFPHEIELWDSSETCVVGTHPQSGQKRVSLSGTTINAARNIAFLVTGDNKAEKVQAILQPTEKPSLQYPAARVNPHSGNLYWFLDAAASKKLK